MKKPFAIFNFSIQNGANKDTVDIHIDGDIVDASTQGFLKAFLDDDTSTSYKSFRNELSKTDAKIYNVYINSVGGHAGDAMAIYDLLVDLQGKGKIVNTIGRGIVASSATLILMAGKSPEMSANSWFMMHTVSGGVYGNVNQVENYAKTMRKFNDSIRDLYVNKSGLPVEDVNKLMDEETWLNAKEAKEKGFVSTVTGEVAFKNRIEKENWDFANTAILNQYNSSVIPTNQTEDMKKLFTDFKETIVNAIKGIQPAAPKEGETVDTTALVNSVAETVGNSFASLGEQMEAQLKTEIENAIKPLNEKIKDLEKKNGELETEIENKLGKQTTSTTNEEKPEVPVGSFD